MLDNATKDIIKSTIPVLKDHGEDITKAFYKELFTRYPEVQSMFDMQKQKNGKQPKALAMAILNAAINIDNLENTQSFVQGIAKIHVKQQVKPEHYPLVGECLIIAIKQILGDAATNEVLEAWGRAYEVIAAYYISQEDALYKKLQA